MKITLRIVLKNGFSTLVHCSNYKLTLNEDGTLKQIDIIEPTGSAPIFINPADVSFIEKDVRRTYSV